MSSPKIVDQSAVLESLPSRDEARAKLAECEQHVKDAYAQIDTAKRERAFWTRLLKFVQATGGGGGAAGGKKRGRKPKGESRAANAVQDAGQELQKLNETPAEAGNGEPASAEAGSDER